MSIQPRVMQCVRHCYKACKACSLGISLEDIWQTRWFETKACQSGNVRCHGDTKLLEHMSVWIFFIILCINAN